MISKWPDEAECRYEVYNPVALFSLWPHRTIFAFSQLFSSELLQTMNARTDPCISSQSPLLLLAIIWALFDLQDLGMLFSYSVFFFGLCPAVTEDAAFPKEICHLLGDATSLSLLLKEWEQKNGRKETHLCIKHCICTLLEWLFWFPWCDHSI